MKKTRVIPALLCMSLCMQAPLASGAAENTVRMVEPEGLCQAATAKSGLKKENGKYYYYVKGRKLKNKWKVLKRSGKYYRYYFGKDGAAYAGKKGYDGNIHKVAKIDGSYYGFDRLGHMLKGNYVVNDKLYVFSSKNGKMNRTVSTRLRKACKYGQSTATLKRLLRNIGQKPLESLYTESCYGDGKDVIYTYRNFFLSAHVNPDGREIFFSVMSR